MSYDPTRPPDDPYGLRPSAAGQEYELYGSDPSPATGPPVAPQPQPQYYQGYGVPPPQKPDEGIAITAMVLGIVGLIMCPACSIVAVIMGHNAKRRVRDGTGGGEGMAMAGIVTGWISIGLWLMLILFYVVVIVIMVGAASAT